MAASRFNDMDRPGAGQRLEKIALFVKQHHQEAAQKHGVPDRYIEYRWLHTLRVANIAKHLAQAEGADLEISLAGCLLQDIDRFDAYRLIEFCLPHMEDLHKLTGVLKERLDRLEKYRQSRLMETDSGHVLFNQKLDLQIAVYKAILEQEAISVVPEL
jgi:HD superfamily phosphohydrolase YqeK